MKFRRNPTYSQAITWTGPAPQNAEEERQLAMWAWSVGNWFAALEKWRRRSMRLAAWMMFWIVVNVGFGLLFAGPWTAWFHFAIAGYALQRTSESAELWRNAWDKFERETLADGFMLIGSPIKES